MYSYDEEREVLTISRIPVAETKLVYEDSEMYKSYMNYVQNRLINDIEEYVIKPLDEALGGNTDIWLQRVDKNGKPLCKVVEDSTASYQGWEYYSAFISLGSTAYIHGGKPFCAMKIPMMDRYGILHKENRDLAIISSLVQDEDITYDKGELKIITEGGNFYNLKSTASNIKMEFNGSSINALEVLAALAVRDKLDVRAILQEALKIPSVRDRSSKFNIEVHAEYDYDKLKDNVLAIMAQPRYRLSGARDKMNKVLSIDRALGKKLAKNLELGDEVIMADEIITSGILNKMKLHKVTSVPIVNVPNLTGKVLRKDVLLPVVRKGTHLVGPLKEFFPENKGDYKNVDFINKEEPIRILAGEVISMELLTALEYNGVQSIKVADTMQSNKVNDVYFHVEVTGNHSVKASEVGVKPKSGREYVYIAEDGSYVDTPAEKLTAYDLLAMLSLYDKLIQGQDFSVIASKDLGLRKKVHMAEDLFRKPLQDAGREFVRIFKNRFKDMVDYTKGSVSAGDMNDPDSMESIFFKLEELWWKKLWKTKVIQSVDKTNPLAFYSSLEKINTITKNKHSITRSMRDLTLGYYGKICPYEIPSGAKLGTVNNKTPYCRITNGIMRTPYRRVIHVGDKSYVRPDIEYLTVQEEEVCRIADIMSLDIDENGLIRSTDRVLARIPSNGGLEKMSVAYVDVKYIDYVNVDPQQSISLACAIMPFAGSNDSARITFEISMSKQAKGLLYNEVPYVLTSAYYDVPRKSPHFMVHAEHDGEVLEANSVRVVVQYDNMPEPTVYEFKAKEVTSTSVIVRTVVTSEGARVKAGDILVTSNFVKDGLLAMGSNALVGYISEGDNYEDGVHIAERMTHKLTSYGANIEKDSIPSVYQSTITIPPNKFTYIRQGDPTYSARCTKKGASESTRKTARSKKLKGFICDVNKVPNKYTKKDELIVTSAISFDYMHSGDKTANRHGNKGVVPGVIEKLKPGEISRTSIKNKESRMVPNSEMSRFLNGEFLDVEYNPAGLSSRMNIGQVTECNVGLCAYILRTRIRSDSFNGASYEDIKTLLEFTYRLANEDDAEAVLRDYPQYPEKWKRKRLEHLDWIHSWKGAFNQDGTAYLYNPKTGKMYENPVLVGVNYIHKLVQEVDKKVHVRAGYLSERYLKKGGGPTEGAARGGGQRMGEMEIAALSAYGASAYQHELLNGRGDNPVLRNNLTVRQAFKHDDMLLDESTAIRRSTEEIIYKLEALGCVVEFDNGELPNPTIEENQKRRVWSERALVLRPDGDGTNEDSFDSFVSKVRM